MIWKNTSAEYGILTAGVSWQGTIDLQWIAWHWEKTYGCVLPAVWLGGSHCKAVHFGVVEYSILTLTLDKKLRDEIFFKHVI